MGTMLMMLNEMLLLELEMFCPLPVRRYFSARLPVSRVNAPAQLCARGHCSGAQPEAASRLPSGACSVCPP